MWEYYAPGMESMQKPMSSHYLLKLKKGGVLALVGGGWAGEGDEGCGALPYACFDSRLRIAARAVWLARSVACIPA